MNEEAFKHNIRPNVQFQALYVCNLHHIASATHLGQASGENFTNFINILFVSLIFNVYLHNLSFHFIEKFLHAILEYLMQVTFRIIALYF